MKNKSLRRPVRAVAPALSRSSPKKKRKPKTVEAYLVSAIRKIWGWSKARRDVKKASKVGDAYRCSACEKLHPKIEIDHLHSMHGLIHVGSESDWSQYIKLMFCEASELRAVCRACHRSITAEQNREFKLIKGKE